MLTEDDIWAFCENLQRWLLAYHRLGACFTMEVNEHPAGATIILRFDRAAKPARDIALDVPAASRGLTVTATLDPTDLPTELSLNADGHLVCCCQRCQAQWIGEKFGHPLGHDQVARRCPRCGLEWVGGPISPEEPAPELNPFYPGP
jgi:hypothetical protein